MRIRTAAIATSLTALFSATASAFVPTPKGERALETSDGIAAPRTARRISTSLPMSVPMAAHVAVQRVKDAGLGHLLWDRDTGAATQFWGAGIAAPNANASETAAASAASAFLREHLDVLAPGASVKDFAMVSNVARDDVRAVGFFQYKDGVRVLGGQIGFLFKNDRLVIVNSTALPAVNVPVQAASFKANFLRGGALNWIAATFNRAATAGDVGDAVILPIVRPRTMQGPDIEYRLVQPVTVKLTDEVGAWHVYVDATNGVPVARATQIRWGTGTVVYNVPDRWPGGTHSLMPAALATHTVNGASVTSDGDGVVNWSGAAAATVSPGLVGPRVRVHNSAGALATTSLSLAANGSATWDETADELKDAQLTTFISTNRVKAFVDANIAPGMNFLDDQMDVFANEGGTCNAYADDQGIHFFTAGGGCGNTGRMPDVVFHEFGHELHGASIIPGVGGFAGDVSEGISDFLSASVTGDHGMGRGFFGTNAPLRDLDPATFDLVYPDDVQGEPHADGEIIAEAMWDTRKALIASLGEAEGVALSLHIYYSIIQRSVDMPSSYAAALLADDDDGNLDNGTPHQCTIEGAFGLHGLAEGTTPTALGIGTPTTSGLTITVPVTAPTGTGVCPPPDIQTAVMTWRVRGTADNNTIDLVKTDLGGGNAEWTGTLPTQEDTTVINFKVELAMSDGRVIAYPDNAADPMYEMYIGLVETIWSAGFEDGGPDWTHGADAGTDEWVAAPPNGLGGDPEAAFEGGNVLGIDLNSNGEYRADSSTWARSPVIDVTGHTEVRLQYHRWLGVEDGFFDTASISVDGSARWSNLDSMQGNGSNTQHVDKEWRFQDLDLADEAADGSVQFEFRLDSDPGLQFGGWTIDDVRVVARVAGGVCGDGIMAGAEQCDDGNTTDGDGCSATCVDENGGDDDGPGMDGGCCSTGTDPSGPAALGLLTLGLVLRRRRRRA